ncbi:hybrid sensor histidine kinase/response regulator [Cognatilysobacter bugurensis]|uniref:histidine kinase n=1 Tax=Cognatilysobacter bugurensis TaxID=543356 RepID=A0A918T131_9GAMM|nr:ATP-binding protein [Lysobacter bugurensis]GHA83928.1 hypothetical protein GCM10007067_22600 [Lysobacter bugurensis]
MKLLVFRRAECVLVLSPELLEPPAPRYSAVLQASSGVSLDVEQLPSTVASSIKRQGFAVVTGDARARLEVAMQLAAYGGPEGTSAEPRAHSGSALSGVLGAHAAAALRAQVFEGADGSVWVAAAATQAPIPASECPACYPIGEARIPLAALSDSVLLQLARVGYAAVNADDRTVTLSSVTAWAEPSRGAQLRGPATSARSNVDADASKHGPARPTDEPRGAHLDFEALFKASPYPYLLIAKDQTILGANPAYLTAAGRSVDSVVGQRLFDAFPTNPDDPASTNTGEVARSIDIAVSTGRSHTSPLLRYATPRDTPEGRVFDERYWSVVHTPVLDADGNVLYVSQNAIDVTDLYRFDPASQHYFLRKEADAVPDVAEFNRPQLHEAMTRILGVERNQLQTLFDQAPGFVAVLMGKECVFDTVNQAYYQLVGHRDVIGRPVMQALPEIAGQGFEEIFAEVLATGKPIVLSERQVALQRAPDGPLEERYLDLLFQPIFDSDGRVTGIFNQGQDVTEGCNARRALGEKLEELAEAKRRSAFQLQLADRLRPLHDPTEIFRQSAALIAGHFHAARLAYGEYHRLQKKMRFHAEYLENEATHAPLQPAAVEFEASDAELIESGGIWVSDDLSRDPRTAGPETWQTFQALEVHAAVVVPLTQQGPTIACLFIGSSTPRAWATAELDLLKEAADRVWTAVERARAEEALRTADERKDQFLAMLAHELRNPLAPIRAAAEIQALTPGDVERVVATSAIISRQVKHMTSLVDDLLDVSRVTRGLVTLEVLEVDLKDVLAHALEQVRPLIEARGHVLSVQLAPAVAHVAGDEKRLVQVFANVLNNAAKYTPEGGRIRVETQMGEDSILITVADSGIGMSQEIVRDAFDLFAQAERTSDRAQGGLGIGLALVKRLVELHQGSVCASSAGLGAGSEFLIRLPRLKVSATATLVARPALTAKTRALRVLVVDDNRDAAAMTAMLIEASGHTAYVAYDAAEGLKRALTEKPDACLLDVGLPGMDGNDMARELRRNPVTSGAMLIAITGYGHDEDRKGTSEAGFDHHLVKPVDPNVLAGLLAQTTRHAADVQ